ncbi:hypothetical protein [Mesorhizobium sp. Cs1299R1N3]|uniref:hypothetical protein n=1 Tax=Mesorhizobium sp. Cs1299R1N3 TaxID=3015173 RepID=UPI00301C5ED8
MAFTLKMYHVTVSGFPASPQPAATPAKARAACWREYTVAYECSFREFLKRSTVERVEPPKGFGERIAVSGKAAYRVTGIHSGQYVAFVREDSDIILRSHPADVSTLHVCDGCGRQTGDPVEDLRKLHADGFRSCCPERNMKVAA